MKNIEILQYINEKNLNLKKTLNVFVQFGIFRKYASYVYLALEKIKVLMGREETC